MSIWGENASVIQIFSQTPSGRLVSRLLDHGYDCGVRDKRPERDEKKQQEENRDLAMEIVSNLCKAIKAECTIVKLRYIIRRYSLSYTLRHK